MKTILLVGGTSGIGKSIMNELLDNHKVINLSRKEPEFSHENLESHSVNVLKDELPDFEQLDGLIYCPGSINLKPISMLKEEDFRADMEINLFGGIKVIQKYINTIKKGDKPSIVMFSTVAVKMGMPFHASVAAAKGAVEGFVKSIAAELAPTVRVNAIAPTVTDTPLAERILKNDRMKENAVNRHPLQKYLEPNEVASFAAYLMSESAAPFSGQIFQMDAGITSLKV